MTDQTPRDVPHHHWLVTSTEESRRSINQERERVGTIETIQNLVSILLNSRCNKFTKKFFLFFF